jgi:hypothetical protein
MEKAPEAPPASPAPSAPAAQAAPAPAAKPRLGWGTGTSAPSPQTAAQRRFGETLVPPPSSKPQEPMAESTTVGLSGVPTPAVGPRLAAFNMARAGTSRDEVARHLKEKFGLEDSGEILDDVFDRAKGGA